MLRILGLLSLALPLALLAAAPASAISAKEKMETCKVGADADNLTGAKRNAFIKKCMGKGNYQPQARKDALKKGKANTSAGQKQP